MGTITDNDTAPSFAIDDVNVSEAAGTVTFTVTKTGATDVASSVTYTAADASAVTPGDYAAGSSALTGVLNFAAGVTTQTIVLNIVNDAVAELTESFNVNLSAATNATISDNQGVATIADDDGAPSFSINDVTVNEGAGTITFTVTKSGATALTTTVDYAVAPNSAVTPGDYAAGASALSGTLSFASGVTTQTIVLNITNDAVFELTESFNVNLSAPTNATISDNQGVGTITDNDTAPNTPPVANPDAVATSEDTPISLSPATLLGNDTDANGDPLTITSVQGATNGAVALVNGSIVFTPAPNYSGPASFTYSISDGKGGTSTATVTLNVSPVNDAPIASNDIAATTLEDTPLIISASILIGNDIDPDGDLLAVTNVQSAVGGTVSLVGGVITFTPTPNFNGPASFTYTITDGKGGFSTANVAVSVTPVNDVPVAGNDSVTTNEDQPLILTPATLLGNDVDVDGDSLTISSVQSAVNGTVSLVNGAVVFAPALNYNGPASFTYTISDGQGGTSTATVNITVVSVNDVPIANSDSVTTDEDQPSTSTAVTLLGNDVDVDGDQLTITSVQNSVNGAVVLVNGAVVFTPVPNYNGPASFTYTISDGQGGTATATVNITVVSVNDVPVANNDTVATNEDQPLTLTPVTLLGNDIDVDADPLTITGVQNPVNGTVALVNGAVVFTPVPNYNGPASFTYTIADGQGAASTATVNITVVSVNDVPVAADDTAADTLEDFPLTIPVAELLADDTDIDGDKLVVISVQSAVNGTVQLVNGNVVFTPTPGYDGPASFTYTASDGQGGTSTARVDLKVIGVNSPPVTDFNASSTEESRTNVPGFTTVAEPALHVLFSLSEVTSQIELRGDRGVFQTDGATSAELAGGLRDDLTFAEGNQFGSRGLGGTRSNDAPRVTSALFVQQAVRHQSLGLEQGLFVHEAVRSSQLEALARSIRIDSFNSAVPGVASLLDGFALGSAVPLIEGQQISEVSPAASTRVAAAQDEVGESATDQLARSSEAAEVLPVTASLGARAPASRGADSFATQLRRNADGFKPRMTPAANRPEAYAQVRA